MTYARRYRDRPGLVEVWYGRIPALRPGRFASEEEFELEKAAKGMMLVGRINAGSESGWSEEVYENA